MRRLSSVITPRHQRRWRWLACGLVLACAAVYGALVWRDHGAAAMQAWIAVLPGALVALLAGQRHRRAKAPLVDEVWLQDHLLWVRRGEQRAPIDLRHVRSVRAGPRFRSPPRIELGLDADSPFGQRFAFLAPPHHGVGRHPVALELEQRRAERERPTL